MPFPPAGLALAAVAAGLGLRAWRRDVHGARLAALAAALGAGEVHAVGGHVHVEGPQSEVFARSVAELLGPARYPRYLLLDEDGRAWSVPAALGTDRAAADRFAATWAEHVGACEVLWARQGRGRELLRAAWRAGGDPVEVVETWR